MSDPQPPMLDGNSRVTPAAKAWIRREARREMAQVLGDQPDDLLDDAEMQDGPGTREVVAALEAGNTTLVQRLREAGILVPFANWLDAQKENRARELRNSGMGSDSRTAAALEVMGPWVENVYADESPEVEEIETGIPRELVESLAMTSEQELSAKP